MKRYLKFAPVQITFFLILGIFFGKAYKFSTKTVLLLTLVFCMLFVFFAVKDRKVFQVSNGFILFFFSTSFFIGVSAISIQNQHNWSSNYLNFNNENGLNSLILRIDKDIKDSKFYSKYYATVININGQNCTGKILVNVNSETIFSTDDVVAVKAEINLINENKNPYGFNYRKYLKNQQIERQITFGENNFLVIKKHENSFFGSIENFRKQILSKLKKNGFKDEELAVISALILGEKNEISSDLLNSYSNAGAIHLLAVSGLHIGIIMLMLSWLFSPLKILKSGNFLVALLTIIFLWLYAVLAGLSPSVVRAVTMFSLVAISLQLHRKTLIYNTLFVSMFLLLLIHPNFLFEIGFQLSYLAVFFIVWLVPKFQLIWSPSNLIVSKLWQLIAVSISAQIGVLPLSLYYFHQFPGLFLVTNLVIIPFLGFILLMGFLVITLALLDILPLFLSNFYQKVIFSLNSTVEFIGNQESFLIKNITISLVFVLGSYGMLVLFFKWTENKSYLRFMGFLFSVVFLQLIMLVEKYSIEHTSELVVFHKTKESIVGKRIGNTIEIYSSDSAFSTNSYELKPYFIKNRLANNTKSLNLKPIYTIGNQTVIQISSEDIIPLKTNKPPIILLSSSAKINLERVIKQLNPSLVIADGSNYKSYIERWKKTSDKNKTPFHSTLQKGALQLN